MKALVTGATGLLGSHIVDRLLERGDDVLALARPASDLTHLRQREVAIAQGDVTDPDSLRQAAQGVDVVYHAAAKVSDWGPWSEFEATTIKGTQNVLEAAVAAGVPRVLHVSTDSVYPNSYKFRGATITEDVPFDAHPPAWDPYQRAKLAAERIAWDFQRDGRLKLSIVRPCLILGERDRSVMPGFVAYLRGNAVYVGRGYNKQTCVYAGDAAEACVLAATQDAGAGQAFNLAAEVLTQRELFTAIAEEIGVRPPRRGVPFRLAYLYGVLSETIARLSRRKDRPTMTRMSAALIAQDYVLDAARARDQLGWRPQVPIREAVRRSVAWLNERRAARADEQPSGRVAASS
jgi:nucleoside-diphosphate-sugar epimerase